MLYGKLFNGSEYRRLHVGIAASIVVHVLFVVVFGARPSWRPDARPPLNVSLETAQESTAAPSVSVQAESASGTDAPGEMAPPDKATNIAPGAAGSPVELDLTVNRYFTARELDVRAEQLNEVSLVYPLRAYQQRIAGKVLLRLYISDRGSIDRMDLVESTPPGVFDEAALDAARSLKFKAAVLNGRNVRSMKVIEVFFDPYESINTP